MAKAWGRPATPEPRTIEPAGDDGDEPETGPLRRCAVTRDRAPKEGMIRFVVGPDRLIVPDLAARLPGRGIWLSARGDVIETARVRGGFAKAARGQVTVPPDLVASLLASLARRIGDTIGLARRAGQAVSGFAKAREWVEAGRAGLIVQASDGSVDERARFRSGVASTLPVVTPLDALALGGLFGRDHAVHVVVAPGQLAGRLRIDAERMAGLAAFVPGDGTRAVGAAIRRSKAGSDSRPAL